MQQSIAGNFFAGAATEGCRSPPSARLGLDPRRGQGLARRA